MMGAFANPERITTHFHLQEGDIVADVGAGAGNYMIPLSAAVGSAGKVYLCDIQKQLVEALGNSAREQGIQNVHALWCDIEKEGGVKLEDSTLDAVLLSNTLFQIEDKETALKEIQRITKVGGKAFIIDWSESFGGIGPHPDVIVTATVARDLFETRGFTFVSDFPAGEHHYGMVFRKS